MIGRSRSSSSSISARWRRSRSPGSGRGRSGGCAACRRAWPSSRALSASWQRVEASSASPGNAATPGRAAELEAVHRRPRRPPRGRARRRRRRCRSRRRGGSARTPRRRSGRRCRRRGTAPRSAAPTRAQDLVAVGVAVGVVDRLEVVEVERRPAPAARRSSRARSSSAASVSWKLRWLASPVSASVPARLAQAACAGAGSAAAATTVDEHAGDAEQDQRSSPSSCSPATITAPSQSSPQATAAGISARERPGSPQPRSCLVCRRIGTGCAPLGTPIGRATGAP